MIEKKIKIFLIITFFLLILPFQLTLAQDSVLALMKNKSDIVAHVRIIEIQGGIIGEAGVEEWSALCKIIQHIKGNIEKGGEIRFHFNRFVFQGKKEPFIVQKDKEYVVFLKGAVGKVRFSSDDKLEISYSLVDRWFGILSYDCYLVERLIKYIEETSMYYFLDENIRVTICKDVLFRMKRDFFHSKSEKKNIEKLMKDCVFSEVDLNNDGQNEIIVKINWFSEGRFSNISKGHNYVRGAHDQGHWHIYSITNGKPLYLGTLEDGRQLQSIILVIKQI